MAYIVVSEDEYLWARINRQTPGSLSTILSWLLVKVLIHCSKKFSYSDCELEDFSWFALHINRVGLLIDYERIDSLVVFWTTFWADNNQTIKFCSVADDTIFDTKRRSSNSTTWNKNSNHYSHQAFAPSFASVSFSKAFLITLRGNFPPLASGLCFINFAK